MSITPANECPLSERELEVLRLVATGATNQQIAHDLAISSNTVKVHLRNIFEKLEVASRTEATMLAVQAGWLVVAGVSPTAEPSAPPASAPAPSPAPRLQLWQRVYLILVVAVTALAVAWPLVARTGSEATLGPFSDQGYPVLGPAPWNDVPRWTTVATLPQPRARLALVAHDGHLYAIGGEGPDGVSNAVYVYDLDHNNWSPRARKLTPVSDFGAVSIGDKIYAMGGCTSGGGLSDVLEVYYPAGDAWSVMSPMPSPRCAHAVATVNGRLYVFGGWDGARYVADVFAYDPATDTWEEASPMPVARGFLGAAELRGHVYVVGGYDGRREYALVHRYDPAADARGEPAWETLPTMTEPRGGLGLASEGSALYAIGGGWRGGLEYNERFDPLSNTWSRVDSPIRTQWRSLGVATLGLNVYVVGGWSGDYLNATAVYQSSFRTFLPLGSRGGGQ
jgi:DNA-binding CsgD family transcriptional regulator